MNMLKLIICQLTILTFMIPLAWCQNEDQRIHNKDNDIRAGVFIESLEKTNNGNIKIGLLVIAERIDNIVIEYASEYRKIEWKKATIKGKTEKIKFGERCSIIWCLQIDEPDKITSEYRIRIITYIDGKKEGKIVESKKFTIANLNKRPGELKWQRAYGARGVPAIGHDGTIFVCGGLSKKPENIKVGLYSLNLGGKIKWFFFEDNDISIKDGPILVGSNGNIYIRKWKVLYCINKKGQLKWKYELGKLERISKGIAEKKRSVYFAVFNTISGISKIVRLDSDGTEHILYKRKGRIEYPVVKERSLYIICCEGEYYLKPVLLCFDVSKPEIQKQWEYNINIDLIDKIALNADDNILVNGKNKIVCIENQGNFLWDYTIKNGLAGCCVTDKKGNIYIMGRDKKLYAMEPDGKMKWVYPLKYYSISTPAIGNDGSIFVGAGSLWVLKPDGSLKWEFKVIGTIDSDITISNDGTIYFISSRGIIHAVNSLCGGPSSGGWPLRYCNNRNSNAITDPRILDSKR